ncbi:MAG: hypothetical protein RL653_318 [Pseudomonadota bacterium]
MLLVLPVKPLAPALFLACVATVGALSRPPEKPIRGADQLVVLPRPELLHLFAAPWQTLVADYYWILEVNQLGRATTAAEHRDVTSYAQLATDLDPLFYVAYYLGGIGTVFNLGREQWMNVEESTALIRKGLRAFPRDIKLRFQLGYNLGILRRDAQAAAPIFEALSKEPGAPKHLAPLATRLYAEAGNFDAGVAMAEALRDAATDDETRAFYEQRLQELASERVMQQVDAAVERHRQRTGQPPADVAALVSAGELPAVPEDPLGGTVELGPTGLARSTAATYRLRTIRQYLKEKGLQP